MKTVLVLGGIVLVLYGLHRLALWMERRGWIFYKHTKASGSTVSSAFQTLQAVWEPGAQHVVEQRAAIDVDEDEAGGPPRDHLRFVLPDDAGTGGGSGIGSGHAQADRRTDPDPGARRPS